LCKEKGELKAWRDGLRKTKQKYVSGNGQTFYCNRSGHHEKSSVRTGQRHPKTQPVRSTRICTSRFTVCTKKTEIIVKWHKTHQGHDLHPGHIGLSSPEKMDIARQLKMGVPKRKVLQNIQEDFPDHPDLVRPIHLTKIYNLHNIMKKYSIERNVRSKRCH